MDIIYEIRRGGDEPLYDLYRLYRNDFIRWGVHHFSCSEDEAKDVFQEVILRFYQNIISGRLTELTSDTKTYLYAIGKYRFLNLIKKNNHEVTLNQLELINSESYYDDPMERTDTDNHNSEMVKQHLLLLDEKSRRILEMYYLEGKDMHTIASEIGYKNADVAKKKKYEIMKKLALLVKNKMQILVLI